MSARSNWKLLHFLLIIRLKWKIIAVLLFCCFSCSVIFSQPTIHSLTPLSGAIGSTVTIAGTHFSPIAHDNIVYFGAVKANVLSATTTSLIVIVPEGATYEPVTVTSNNLTAVSAQRYVVTFSCGGPITPSLFKSPALESTHLTYDIKNADIDGDGKTDIIYCTPSTLVVLRNTSSLNTTSFAPGISIDVDYSFKFEIGDVDGDGKLDIIAPQAWKNVVSIIKNNSTPGTLSFASKIDYATGSFPYSASLGNLDEDGKPDLVVVNMNGNTISVFKNMSTSSGISFGGKIDYATGKQCRDVAIADIDGDDKNDIVVTSQSDQIVSLFRNIGTVNTILFSAKLDWGTPSGSPEDIVIADFDDDNKLDFAITNNDNLGSISVFINNSTIGSFSYSSRKEYSTGPHPYRMACADFNGDGKPDLAIKEQFKPTLSLLENTSTSGNVSFASKVEIATASTDREHLTIGDINSDGKLDIAVTDSKNIWLFLNNAMPVRITATHTIPTCIQSDGSINATGTGGVAPYQYNLGTHPFQSSGSFTNLPPGIYTVRVKDAKGCLDSIDITLPSNSVSFGLAVTVADCNSSNGSVTVNASGTNPPFLYKIDNNGFQSSPHFANLAPGIYNMYVKDNSGCLSQQGFVISTGCIAILPTLTNAICGLNNGSIQVQVSGGTAPYQYSLDGIQYASVNQFTNLAEGSYTIYVKDALGITNSKSVKLSNLAAPIISSVVTTPADCLNSNGSINILAQNGTLPFEYSIQSGVFQSSPLFSSIAAGSYKVTVQDANGCFESQIITVPVNNTLMVNVSNNLTICEGSSVTLLSHSNGNSFSWTPAKGLSNPSLLSPVASPNITTEYIITATLGVCTAKDTVTIGVHPAPVAYAGNDTTICLGQNVVLNGSGGIAYSWFPSSYLSDLSSSNPLMTMAPKGSYAFILHVKDDKGCTSILPDTVNVSVIQALIDAGKDKNVLTNQPVQLQAHDSGNLGFVKYTWSPSQGLSNPNVANPISVISRNIIYTITAQTLNGCTAIDTIRINVYDGTDFYVPNAFTPNNDGRNDILKAFPVGIKVFLGFSIYNRWGQLVFQTNDAVRGWDGKLNGILQTGVFVWIVQGLDYNGSLIKREGTTTIIR
jgi:gliding motility-associated-like protein